MWQSIWYLLFIFLLAGCFSQHHNPIVIDRVTPKTVLIGEHTVKHGETLYLIAWRYGRDFRELSSINNITKPYRIYPGQRIKLSANNKNTYIAKPNKQVKRKIHHKNQETIFVSSNKDDRWFWPTTGIVSKKFNNGTRNNNGIDIDGKMGTPIYATRDGKVVYSGSGLRGLGHLIILKHDDRYLSAYAHNQRLFVKEGDLVKAGGKIAEMGNSDTNKVKLHFEIRRDGKPVDPLIYLSKK